MNGTYQNIDCMELMANLKDKEVDLAIVDPEYGINVNFNIGKRKNKKVKHVKKEWDKKRPSDKYFSELFRVSKNQIIWGGNYFTDKIPQNNEWIVWDKMITGDVNYSACEIAYTSFLGCIKKVSISIQTNYLIEQRIHPTQKPVTLYEWLLTNYAKPNHLILDTHCGSASSLIACENLGFKYIASELDKDYYHQSLQRLETHLSQGKLFQRVGATEIKEVNLFE